MVEFYNQASGMDLIFGAFALSVVVGTLGAIGNAILKSSGFGTVLNGCLLLAGCVAGVAARAATIGLQ